MLAHDRNGENLARENGFILLPLYQSQGSDGFFLVREISLRWLTLSAMVRRMRLERVLHLLPGIERDPRHPDTLIVNPNVPRWLALDFLHFFGFRRRHSDGEKIVVSRRPHDITSLSDW